jgi:uracil phosphoribosyltransferase
MLGAPMLDRAYFSYAYKLPELSHAYGPNVHLVADPVLLTQLARMCQSDVVQPDITWLVRDMYETLVRMVIANELPRAHTEVRTRMYGATPKGVWAGSVLDPTTRVVTVDIARAGTLPSQIAFECLTRLLDPKTVRQDHLYMNRVTDEAGTVTGVAMSGNKIGGDVDGAVVLLPDPMGATGGSMSWAASVYKKLAGTPRKIVSINLIITPEYIRRLLTDHPDMVIYAIRLDRGMSSEAVLQTKLGERVAEECGLNERQYIVPGAGGLGEILNNSYV